MKRLVILPYGELDNSRVLSAVGERQMVSLAVRLRPYLTGDILVFSSAARKVEGSAYVISAHLNGGHVIPTISLGSSLSKNPPCNEQIFEFVARNEDRGDSLVLVCHRRTVSPFAEFYSVKQGIQFQPCQVGSGQAVLFDAESKTSHIV